MPEPPLPDLTDAFERAGLIDVSYAVADSPLGELLLARTGRGLVRVAYLQPGVQERRQIDADQLLAELAARISPRVLRAPGALDDVRRQLDQYFAGTRRDFSVALDWRLVRGFGLPVLSATAQIPFGGTSSYGAVAAAAGNPRAARAAGTALAHNPLPIIVPCHRVLAAGGALGGYTGGTERKRTLLRIEGHDL